MTCNCCQSTACCNGPACNTRTKSECAHNGGFPVAGTCAVGACIDNSGQAACLQASPCECYWQYVQDGGTRTHIPGAACNCTQLQEAGYFRGGCRWRLCEQCTDGSCVNSCPFPRSCCAGTCCPLPQRCFGNSCIDKCDAWTTFCAGTGSAYACCSGSTKCCGASGCLSLLPTAAVEGEIDVAYDRWVSTGRTVPAGVGFWVTAQGGVFSSYVFNPIGPGGDANYSGPGRVMNGQPFMCVIGRLGGGAPFFIGDGAAFGDAGQTNLPQLPRPSGSGLLEVRQNSTDANPNAGGIFAFEASAPGDPCPGFTPAAIGEPIIYGEGEEPPKLLPGPGAALKDILKLGGIVASPTCSCNARAAQMDAWGSGECIRRCREIVGWLKEESEKRDLWFFAPLGYALVFAAVALAALKRFWKSNNQ